MYSLTTQVIKYSTSWGYCEYEVIGSTSTYSVLLDLPLILIPYHCTCPAFTSVVLESETFVMVGCIIQARKYWLTILIKCKHVLAARLAQKMSMCSERPTAPEDLAILFQRQFPVSDYRWLREQRNTVYITKTLEEASIRYYNLNQTWALPLYNGMSIGCRTGQGECRKNWLRPFVLHISREEFSIQVT